MNGSVVASLFFAVACLVAITALYFVRKSSQRLSGLSWVTTSLISLTCWHALVAVALVCVRLPVNIVSLGVADVAAGGALWWATWRRKDHQEYIWSPIDAAVVAALGLFTTGYFALRTNGAHFAINYASTDPANLLFEALNVVKNQVVEGMFYQALTNGLLIEAVGPLTTPDYYYKVFVFSDGLFLFIAGLAFFAVIRRHLTTRLTRMIGFGAMFVYLCGYPLNSTLWGFVWLGMGVTLIAHVAFLADSMTHDDVPKWQSAALLMLGSLGLIICYAMFAPVVFLGLGVVVVAKYRTRHLVSTEAVLVGFAVFLVPVVVGLVFMLGGVFGDGTTISSAISSDGASYRDLFSDFVPFAPVAVFGAYTMHKARQLTLPQVMLPISLVFVIVLFGLGMAGKVSAYYFFKSYNLLWFVVLYLAVMGVARLATREAALLLGLYGTVWALVLVVALSGVEQTINSRNEGFDPLPPGTTKSAELNAIFAWNLTEMSKQNGPGADQLALYHYVFNNCRQGDARTPLVGHWADVLWYQAITGQHDPAWNFVTYADPNWVLNMVRLSGSKCVAVLTDQQSVPYLANRPYFDSLPRVFVNDAGFVATPR